MADCLDCAIVSSARKCFNLHGNHGISWSCSVEDYIGPAVVSMHMDIASMVLAMRPGCAPRWRHPHAQVIAFA